MAELETIRLFYAQKFERAKKGARFSYKKCVFYLPNKKSYV